MQNVIICVLIAVFVLAGKPAQAQDGGLLTTQTAGTLHFELLGTNGAASWLEFGLGTPDFPSDLEERRWVFFHNSQFGNQLRSHDTVNAGLVAAGQSLDFYVVTTFANKTHVAFSSRIATPTPSDLVVFHDTDNSLGFGGTVAETLGIDDWVLHLDDAASMCCDDDDNELIIHVYISPAPMS